MIFKRIILISIFASMIQFIICPTSQSPTQQSNSPSGPNYRPAYRDQKPTRRLKHAYDERSPSENPKKRRCPTSRIFGKIKQYGTYMKNKLNQLRKRLYRRKTQENNTNN